MISSLQLEGLRHPPCLPAAAAAAETTTTAAAAGGGTETETEMTVAEVPAVPAPRCHQDHGLPWV